MTRLFLWLFSTLIVTSAVLAGGYWHDAYVAEPAPNAPVVDFLIENGDSVKEIAVKLKDSGLIKSEWFFEVFARLNSQAGKIQAGTFRIPEGLNFRDLLAMLSNARGQEVQITIPEGYTAEQIGETVRAALPEITVDEWNAATGKKNSLIPSADADTALNADLFGKTLEGFLFPDTYRLAKNATAEQIVAKLFETYLVKSKSAGVTTNDHDIVAHGLTEFQFITLASIIEREVQRPEDMKRVAGIFLRRLAAHMPLQSDATVNYVIQGEKNASLTIHQTQIDSPYNTYRNVGLPVGPISNPGKNAMDAVLHPEEGGSWYYFLTPPDGSVKYARTYEEHLENKRRYLR